MTRLKELKLNFEQKEKSLRKKKKSWSQVH